MALINFENPNIKVIPAKHLYVVDKDGNKQEIKYIKDRNWWDHIFSENINITSAEVINKSDVKEISPHRFLEFFNSNKMFFQAKAIYFIDSQGNVIEFINPIHKDWVNDYVTEDVFTSDLKLDIPLNISETLDTAMSNTAFDEMTHIIYPDIPLGVSEDLIFSINNPLGAEGLDITLIPLFILNIEANVNEDLNFTIANTLSDSAFITLNSI